MIITVADFNALRAAAQRKLATAIVANQTKPQPVYGRECLADIAERIALAERTAKGGCFQTAYRMLRGVV